MQEYRSFFGKKYKHPDIKFRIDDVAGNDVDWLLSYFENEVQGGKVFRPGEMVQIGWMFVLLKDDKCGNIEIWEPQFDTMPIRWTYSVNSTIRHLILQKSVCEQFGVDPLFPSLRQAGIVARNFCSNNNSVFMARDEPFENDSGWCFSDITHQARDGEFQSLYEICLHQPLVIPFLALPVGASLNYTGHQIDINVGGMLLSSKTNHLLNKLKQI